MKNLHAIMVSDKKYYEIWDKLILIFKEELGLRTYAYDPTLSVCDDYSEGILGTVQLPFYVAERIAASTGRYTPISPQNTVWWTEYNKNAKR